MGPKMDRLARKFAQLVESPKNFAEYTARLFADKYAGVSGLLASLEERGRHLKHTLSLREIRIWNLYWILSISRSIQPANGKLMLN